jgi:hypothetical protein
VYYETQTRPDRWHIFNQDTSATFQAGTLFYIKIAGRGQNVFVHTVTQASITGGSNHMTLLDHPLLNNQPNAKPVITPVWQGTYNNHHTGVYYNAANGRWHIFNQDLAAMPVSAIFNVYVPQDDSINIVHTVTAQNVIDTSDTILPNNFAENTGVIVTPAWTQDGGQYVDAPIGVEYFSGALRIRRLDGQAMPIGARFHVHISNTGDVFGDGELLNGGFEVPGVAGSASAVGWVQTRQGAGSQRICNRYTRTPQRLFSSEGDCAFRLQGALGQERYIIQYNTVLMQPNQEVDLRVRVRATNLSGARIVASYTLDDGSRVRLIISPTALAGTYDYTEFIRFAPIPAGRDAVSMTLTISINNSAGSMLIDDLRSVAIYEPPAPLALPPAPLPLPTP